LRTKEEDNRYELGNSCWAFQSDASIDLEVEKELQQRPEDQESCNCEKAINN
jgi:hypothetical protein